MQHARTSELLALCRHAGCTRVCLVVGRALIGSTQRRLRPYAACARSPARSCAVDDMLSMVSCNGWRAKQEDVMAKLLADHCGYCALEEQLLRKLGVSNAPWAGLGAGRVLCRVL